MNKKQKIVIVTMSCILIIIIGLIVYIELKGKPVVKGNKTPEINTNESTELLKRFNALKDEIVTNSTLEEETDEIKTYSYNGDVKKFNELLNSVYTEPFYKNEVFELITNDEKETMKIHLPKTCNLKNIDESSKISKGNENESTIVIGEDEYVVVKDHDNYWKFLIPIPICE